MNDKAPTFNQICDIAYETLAKVRAAGYDTRRCVWELSPSILNTIRFGNNAEIVINLKAVRREYFMTIPIRRGVTDEKTGIMLKLVHPEKWG